MIFNFKKLIFIIKEKIFSSNSNTQQDDQITDNDIKKRKKYHDKNYTDVDDAIHHIKIQLKSIIASGNSAEKTFTHLYTMLLGVWCEARLHKLLYEKNAFSEDERAIIYNTSGLEEKWKKALAISILKNNNLDISETITNRTIDFSYYSMYTAIDGFIKDYFSPVIKRRNKVAHGQWYYPFKNIQNKPWNNSGIFKVCPITMNEFKNENILTIEYKFKILSNIATSINNLSLESSNYQTTDFNTMYQRIVKSVDKLDAVDFSSYKTNLQLNYQRYTAR